MTLDDIAESIGTVSEEQQHDDHDRLDDSDIELSDRQTEEYDGGWSVDH